MSNNYTGTVHKLGDHIDTDAIIPARFLVTTDTAELGSHCMEGLEEGWGQRIKTGDFIVAGRNFGCGSSREHAPLAILGAGIPVVIAHSFARIFYRNSFNMGLLPIELGDKVADIAEGDALDIDLNKGVIHNQRTGEDLAFPPLPPAMLELLQGGGLIEYVKKKLQAVRDKN